MEIKQLEALGDKLKSEGLTEAAGLVWYAIQEIQHLREDLAKANLVIAELKSK